MCVVPCIFILVAAGCSFFQSRRCFCCWGLRVHNMCHWCKKWMAAGYMRCVCVCVFTNFICRFVIFVLEHGRHLCSRGICFFFIPNIVYSRLIFSLVMFCNKNLFDVFIVSNKCVVYGNFIFRGEWNWFYYRVFSMKGRFVATAFWITVFFFFKLLQDFSSYIKLLDLSYGAIIICMKHLTNLHSTPLLHQRCICRTNKQTSNQIVFVGYMLLPCSCWGCLCVCGDIQ